MRSLKLVIAVCLLLAACGRGDEPDKVNVFVAASLIDAVGSSGWEYEQQTGVHVNHSPGASSTLARQIADGAPAHVYFSASRKWIDYLEEKGKLAGDAQVFARNDLVCIVPKGGPKFGGLDRLDDPYIKTIAIADVGVPAGEYARQALQRSGTSQALKPKLVGMSDVRAVLNAVQMGQADAGFVYATDVQAYSEGVDVDFEIDGSLHDPVECYVVKIKGAPVYVDAYIEFMTGPGAHAKLKELGFRR